MITFDKVSEQAKIAGRFGEAKPGGGLAPDAAGMSLQKVAHLGFASTNA